MHHQGVNKGEQAIDVIQRRPSVAFIEAECPLLRHNEMIEDIEIDVCRIPLKTPQLVKRMFTVKKLHLSVKPKNGLTHLVLIDLFAVVADGPL
jgi:hypothetical protein